MSCFRDRLRRYLLPSLLRDPDGASNMVGALGGRRRIFMGLTSAGKAGSRGALTWDGHRHGDAFIDLCGTRRTHREARERPALGFDSFRWALLSQSRQPMRGGAAVAAFRVSFAHTLSFVCLLPLLDSSV